MFTLTTQGSKEYAALTTKLRRHNLERRTDDCHDPVQFVAIPIDGGRAVLSNDSTMGGLYRPVHDVPAEITSLVNRMAGGRISGSYSATRKAKKAKDLVVRVRLGVVKISAPELAAVCLRHGAPKVVPDPEEVLKRGSAPKQKWDISALDADARLALWTSLGIRVWSGRGIETTTRGTAIDAVAA